MNAKTILSLYNANYHKKIVTTYLVITILYLLLDHYQSTTILPINRKKLTPIKI